MSEVYVSPDVETDGQIPGVNSMLSFGSAAEATILENAEHAEMTESANSAIFRDFHRFRAFRVLPI